MNGARALTLLAIVALSGLLAWFMWPRPDLSIEVEEGGIATVVDHLGRRAALSDTIFVGGRGARRTVRVVNRDSIQHQLALFTVKARSEMQYVVPPGTFGGFCSAHPTSKTLTLVVR